MYMYIYFYNHIIIFTVLPELAAHDHLFRFWKAVSGRDDVSTHVILYTCTCMYMYMYMHCVYYKYSIINEYMI